MNLSNPLAGGSSQSPHITTFLKQPILLKNFISAKLIDSDSPSQ